MSAPAAAASKPPYAAIRVPTFAYFPIPPHLMYPSPMRNANGTRAAKTLTLIPIYLGVVIFLLSCYHAIGFTWDDPFISFRYARNFAEGYGLVYNTGERVEGYSNFLYVLICALAYISGIGHHELGLLYFAKIFGLACAFGSIILVWKYLKRWDYFPSLNYLPILIIGPWMLLTNIFFAGWSMAGMETVFFPFLLMLGSYLLLLEVQRAKPLSRFISWPAFVFFLSAITRPEGPVLWVAALIALLSMRKKYNISGRIIVPFILTFLIFMAAFLTHRLWYFGDILPNTYYAKATGGYEQIIKGLTNFTAERSFAYIGNIIPIVLIFIPLCYPRIRDTFAYRLILFQVLIYFIFIIGSGRDWMGGYRFFVHVLPLLATGATMGIWALLSRDPEYVPGGQSLPPFRKVWLLPIALLVLSPPGLLWVMFHIKAPKGYDLYLNSTQFLFGIIFIVAVLILEIYRGRKRDTKPAGGRNRGRVVFFVLIIILLFNIDGAGIPMKEPGMSFIAPRVFEFESGFLRWPPPMMIDKYLYIGRWMQHNLDPNGRLAIGEAGAIPYLSGQPIVDCFGLMDKVIARMPGATFFDKSDSDEAAEYILSRHPKYFLFKGRFTADGSKIIPSWHQFHYIQHIWSNPEFREHYSIRHVYEDFIIYERQ